MKRRVFALTLALSMVLLAACGPKGGDHSSGSQSSSAGSGSDVSAMAPDGSASTPDSSAPDASQPDGSGSASSSDSSDPSGSESSSGGSSSSEDLDTTITLNKTDVTLKMAGASFQLRYVVHIPGNSNPAAVGVPSYASSDEKIATVAKDGTVTAVAPGKAIITVTYEDAEASCIVRCNWEDSQPDNGGSSSGSGSSSGGTSGDTSAPAGNVDLSAFATNIMGQYEFGMLQLLDADLMEQLYPGMGAVSAEQKLVYGTLMTMNNGEFGLVQVKDSKDVDAVKAIFQARIDGMVNGGAWYPEPTRIWTENSRVVSNGNYVMMIVHESCDAIVDAFNALF